MRTLLFALVALVAVPVPATAAGIIPEPVSYAKPTPGGEYVLVMFGDPAFEERQGESARARFREFRAEYPRPGLYRAAGPKEPVWPLDGPYAPLDGVFPSADGVHLVRLDGEAWQTKDYPGRNRLPPDVEAKQLDAPAVTFLANGKVTRTYTLREVVADPAKLPHSPQHVLWVAGPVLNDDTGRFVLTVQDSSRVVFDARTGEVLSREKVGLDNPLARTVLLVSAGLIAVILAGWAWLALVKWRRVEVEP